MQILTKPEIMRLTNTLVGALDYGSDDLFTSAVITSILTGIPFSEEEISGADDYWWNRRQRNE